MDVLLKSIPIYTNQEEIQRLQLEPNAETLVADQISAVVNELASELLASVATELASPNVHGCIKDLTKSEELRTSGNAFFAKGKYLAAVAKFSESLRFLPPLEAETYAKVLCNRALCLSKAKLHKLAEYDSTEAIAIKPDHAKAFYRRAIAHRDQNNLSSAKSDAQRAVKLLEEQNASTEEAEALLTSLLEKCKIDAGGGDGLQKNEPMWTTTHSVPQDLWNDDNDEPTKTTPNSAATKVPLNWSCSLPEISKLAEARTLVDPKTSLKLAESPKLGRHLVVNTQKLEENTDIILDQPVAHVLEKHQRLHRCGHCCKELPLGGAYFWPCTACSVAVFCSRECRDDENVHHVAGGPECGVPWTALLPPEAVLAVRLASRLKRDQGNDSSNSSNNSSSVGDGSASKVVSSLQTCFSEIDTEEAIWRATMACAAHAAYTIAYQRSLKAPATTSIPFSIADIVRALGIIKINGLAITPPVFGSKEDSVGIAIYPISSFLSHSCATANVSVRFEGTTAIIRTLSALEAGTPLLHCYGPQAGEMTTKQRRMMLKDQYHFYCECDGCVVRSGGGTGTDKNEEVEKEAEMVGLRCSLTKGCLGAMQVPACSSSVPGSSSIDAGITSKYDLSIEDEEKNSVKVVGCTKCTGKVLSEVDWNTKIAPRLAKALECYSTGCRMLEMAEGEDSNKEIEKAVKLLEESLKIRQELLHKHNQVLGATHNALSWVEEESNSKKHSNKIIHLKACLEIAERLFPAESTNIAFERLKLGTLLQQSESKDDIKQGKDLVSASMITLERYFGNAAAAVTDENL